MEELNNKLRALQLKSAILSYAAVLLLIVSVVTLKLFGAYGLIAFGSGIAMIFFASSAKKKYLAFYKETIVPSSIKSCIFLDDITYSAADGISESTIQGSNLIKDGTGYEATDLILAEINGTRFSLCNVSITQSTSSSEGHDESTLFQGRWVCFVPKKPFEKNLKIICGRVPNYQKSETEINHGDCTLVLDKEHGEVSFELEEIMPLLTRFKNSHNSPMAVMLTKNLVNIAIYSHEPFMEGSIVSKMDAGNEKKKIVSYIREVADLVDRLSDRKFSV